jgi:plasmid stabilization system protein ParE
VKVLWTEPAATAFQRLSRRFQQAILDRIEMISEFPEMYPVRQHQPYAGFRYFVMETYCLSYVVAEDAVIILALFSGRRATPVQRTQRRPRP